jgi:hypothetical protein
MGRDEVSGILVAVRFGMHLQIKTIKLKEKKKVKGTH